jgi:AraC-like DNA-binding protein
MTPFLLKQGLTDLLNPFPHILEINVRKHLPKNETIDRSLKQKVLTLYFILDGKHEWYVDDIPFILLPNDLLILREKSYITNSNVIFDQGAFIEIILANTENEIFHKSWSGINSIEGLLISQILEQNIPMVIQGFKIGKVFIKSLILEINSQEIGFMASVNAILDQIFIHSSRTLNQQNLQGHDFTRVFLKLDKLLRENLSHPWTVQEMGKVVGLGITTFTEKTKSNTGFAPLQYLINLRIAESMRMIKNTDRSMTTIALDLGFYSSQHFSSTFKKMTGISPKTYRKNGI